MGHRIGTKRNDRYVRHCQVIAEDFHRLDPTHAWQVDVHQDHLRLMDACRRDTSLTVWRAAQMQIGAARDKLLDQFQVGRIIFDVKHRS